jgi:ribosomal-protein-alanine N-acetyltransferase
MTLLSLRYMTTADIAQVVMIDNQSFDPPWSARSYAYDIREASHSHMVVLERHTPAPPAPGWRRWLHGWGAPRSDQRQIVGYGGLWHIVDEGHISTIASHPAWRGCGFGELVLAGMVRKAITLGAAYIVLEVRVSNHIAQNLYLKYGFYTSGTKRRYYRNNNEDAYEMRLDLDERSISRVERRFASVQARIPFVDHYTTRDK